MDDTDPGSGLLLMVSQMREVATAGLYYAALMLALSLPDICGALGSENGRSSGAKTRRWLEEWGFSAVASSIYGLRCSLLHQGSAFPDDGSERVIFIEPNPLNFGMDHLVVETRAGAALFVDVPSFVEDVAVGVERWLGRHGSSSTVQRNLLRFAHRRPNGLPPFIDGVPVIA